MFDAHVLKALIASPTDVGRLRDEVERAIHDWNGTRSESAGVILLPRRWETDAIPLMTDEDPQSVINSQLVQDADLVFGVFQATLGRSTPRAASGTADELEQAHKGGKPVHIYFSAMPLPRDHDRDQLKALDEFKREMSNRSLYKSFDTERSLSDQVRAAIEHDVGKLNLGSSRNTRPAGARVRAQYRFDREPDRKGNIRTRRQRIEFVNSGDVPAEDVTFQLEALDDLLTPTIWGAEDPFTLPPDGGEYTVSIASHSGTSDRLKITMAWTENGESKTFSHSISI